MCFLSLRSSSSIGEYVWFSWFFFIRYISSKNRANEELRLNNCPVECYDNDLCVDSREWMGMSQLNNLNYRRMGVQEGRIGRGGGDREGGREGGGRGESETVGHL